MTTLRITVDWLDRTYDGEEWPPSPWRLFGAMRAGSARHYPDNPVLDAAMRHLETLGPPIITAPRAEVRAPVTAAVPNDDADRELALYARGEPAHAREQHRRSVSLRTRRPRVVDGEVAYDWPATPSTAGHAGAIVTIARCVSVVGQGTDLALARAELIERPAPGPLSLRARRAVPRCGVSRSRCSAPTGSRSVWRGRARWRSRRWSTMRSGAPFGAQGSSRAWFRS